MSSALKEMKLTVTYDDGDTAIQYDHKTVLNGVSTDVATQSSLTKTEIDSLSFTYSLP